MCVCVCVCVCLEHNRLKRKKTWRNKLAILNPSRQGERMLKVLGKEREWGHFEVRKPQCPASSKLERVVYRLILSLFTFAGLLISESESDSGDIRHPRNSTTPLPSQYLLSQGCRGPHRRGQVGKLEMLIFTRSSHFWSTEYSLWSIQGPSF